MKIIFLDIDGVLNSRRSAVAFSGFPWDIDPESLEMFDKVAVALIRNVCEKTGAVAVLSSTWRGHSWWKKIGPALDIPIIDRTPAKINSARGHEIKMWLDDHPTVTRYAIIDDDCDMLPEQEPFFVRTHVVDGLQLQHYEKLILVLGIK